MNPNSHSIKSEKGAVMYWVRFTFLVLVCFWYPLFSTGQVKDKDQIKHAVNSCTQLLDKHSGVIYPTSLNGVDREYLSSNPPSVSVQKGPDANRQITFKINFDDSKYYFMGGGFKDENGRFYSFRGLQEDKTIVTNVPSGIYNLYFAFREIETCQYTYIVKENVDFDTTTSLDIDIAEATNRVHFTMRLPDGEIITPQVARIINSLGDEEIVSEGNISTTRTMSSQLCIGDNINKSMATIPFRIPYDYERNEYLQGFETETEARTIMINPVSDNVSLYYCESFIVDGKMNFVEAVWHGGDNTEVDNIDVPYVQYDFDFLPTPFSTTFTKPNGTQNEPYRDYQIWFSCSGINGLGWESSLEELLHVNVSKMSKSFENDLNLKLYNNEYGIFHEDPEEPDLSSWRYYFVGAGSLYLSDDHEFVNSPIYIEYRGTDNYYFPDVYSNPLAFKVCDTDLKIGETTPFWCIDENVWHGLTFTCRGMLGEKRTTDYLDSELVKLTVDGVEKTDEAGLNSGLLGSYFSSRPGQKWEIELRNNNVEVDGLKGSSTINLAFTAKEIPELPVLQQIQFRNSEEKVTNRFNCQEEGQIILALGNFSHHYDSDTYLNWFECDPVSPDVTVEYAPYNSDNWQEIKCQEDKDKFYLPGMGCYFSGSLAYINMESSSRWYDLRVSIRAANGDEQSQVISPAFRIDNIVGIDCVNSDKKFKVEGNNIISDEDIEIIDMTGHSVKGENLHSGIYIVLDGTSASKVVIR